MTLHRFPLESGRCPEVERGPHWGPWAGSLSLGSVSKGTKCGWHGGGWRRPQGQPSGEWEAYIHTRPIKKVEAKPQELNDHPTHPLSSHALPFLMRWTRLPY